MTGDQMRVLIAVDNTKHSLLAIKSVAARHWPAGTKFLLLASLEPCLESTLKSNMRSDCRHQESHKAELLRAQKLLRRLQSFLSRTAASRSEVTTCVLEDDPVGAIRSAALDWQADLVILGKRRLTLLQKLFERSIGEAVLRRLPCSVMLVRRPPLHQREKILIAYDGSSVSEEAVWTILNNPLYSDSEIKIVSVISELSEYLGWRNLPALDGSLVGEEGEELFPTKLGNWLKLLRTRFGPKHVSLDLRRGMPEEQILQSACEWKADLLVLGSHGRTGPSRVLLGSVAGDVASKARCSVEIVLPGPSPRHGLRKSG